MILRFHGYLINHRPVCCIAALGRPWIASSWDGHFDRRIAGMTSPQHTNQRSFAPAIALDAKPPIALIPDSELDYRPPVEFEANSPTQNIPSLGVRASLLQQGDST